ncbi:hypothetical protein VD0002_g4418 [Verticillium dahliae]|uniref:Cyclin-D1-binding protein 1-like N-terminal domain-containing protein n=2 Tax=Verticillium dahliae TaxID=27337 RepID=G2XFE4_VERDV|nr:uncharacterized protein VDAG_09068 [Verticillium dahliae VdLs.17]KAF3347917.1 hypothetical protein VdG2_03895 [Verticillium dahliae VDG2]KAH6692050.1 hypothetical protein EV126DRAFT_430055 [Verticillium dahliae]EGY18542.1 hypothetical protein VDAG_09068 [Verticillium dahliae VdLs.17]PNH28545.1 hypothetical protein BJF96_g8208 [Verticillium dahliae]PNH50764.1 hypothetical protein VD0003_g6429 [Verticillium dahliae]
MPSDAVNTSVEGLNVLAAQTVHLLQQLEPVLLQINSGKDTPESTIDQAASQIDALALARDSATLIRAHSTKISVLIINEPFTPSAIIKVLRELVGSAIQGIASAAQTCTAERYTSTVRKDLAWKSYTVLKELRELIQKIPKDGKILTGDKKTGAASKAGKGSIVATGTLWAACDEVTRFCNAGVGGCFINKVEEFRATLKDVMEELKEWGDEVPEDEDDDEDDEAGDAEDNDSGLGSMMPSAQEMVDDIMGAQQTIPRDDPDKIRERLDSCLKRLRLTTLLYQAIVKRRLKILPSFPTDPSLHIPQRLDNVMELLRKLPNQFDELAGAFYELDPDEIDNAMDQCFVGVRTISDHMSKPWAADRDEFSDWAEKFQEQIKKS